MDPLIDNTRLPDLSAPAHSPPLHFRFNGSGSEYFRIWIVNLLLTILTLGIYSAWAKVRRLRYFYGQTELDGTRFEYHGSPTAILKGRLIALGLFIVYNRSVDLFGVWGVALMVSVALVFPLLVRSSFRFRAANSSYRGLRFAFDGSVGGLYAIAAAFILGVAALGGLGAALVGIVRGSSMSTALQFIPLGLVLVGSLLLYPLCHHAFKAYQHGHARWGTLPWKFAARRGQFIAAYAATAGVGVCAALIAAALGALLIHLGLPMPEATGAARPPGVPTGIIVLMLVAYAVMAFTVAPYWVASIQNLVWNETQVGEHRFRSRIGPGQLAWIWASNFVLIALTLGLFAPWASVRLARYRAQCLVLLPASTLDTALAAATDDPSAVGDEALGFFDFDVSL
jgi:uncharacterized membrane protein YjgN (DUF898 family)